MFFSYYESPIGYLQILANEKAILEIDIASKKEQENVNRVIIECKKELDEYFNKERSKFTFPLELNGTDFQKKVWMELLNIPYGELVTYKDVAKRIGNEKGIRAVANVIGKNKHLIVIPCHRVIGTNGTLTGFRAGIPKKEYLLKLEGVNNFKK